MVHTGELTPPGQHQQGCPKITKRYGLRPLPGFQAGPYTPATKTLRPATTPTGTPTWAPIRHDRRCKVNMTIFEHVHSRQFCVTDAHLPRRAHAIQIGGLARGHQELFVSSGCMTFLTAARWAVGQSVYLYSTAPLATIRFCRGQGRSAALSYAQHGTGNLASLPRRVAILHDMRRRPRACRSARARRLPAAGIGPAPAPLTHAS